MNRTRTTTTASIALLGLALVAAPAMAQEYVVEPIVDETALSGQSAAFTEAELDQLLAPIALYPDALLSQVLIAATYPLEIVEAARWSRANPGLQGEDAVTAVEDQEWDASVKSLVAFPDLLARLDQDLEWTRQLGEAMLLQERDVMDSIQFLRAKADEAGSLQDTEQVRVVREQETIVIEPASERVVYVPYYDTRVVYGSWWRPAYPPIYWTRPPYYTYYGSPGFYWSSGIYVSTGFFFSDFYWPHRNVVIVRAPYYYHPPRHYYGKSHYYVPGERWRHNPWHRRSVKYRHDELRKRYEPHIRPPSARQPEQRAGSRSAPRNYRELQGSLRAPRETRDRAPQATRATDAGRQARVERQLRTQRDPGAALTTRAPRERTEGAMQSRPQSGSRQAQAQTQTQSYRTTRPQTQVRRVEPSRQAASASRAAPTRQAAPARQVAPARQAAPASRAAPTRQAAAPRQAAPSRQAAPARPAQSRPPSSGTVRSTRPSQSQASSSRSRAAAPKVRQGNSGGENRSRRQLR